MSDPDWFSGGFEHLGAFMRQNPKVLEVFPEFFARHRFDVVVELGADEGGLSMVLKDCCDRMGARFHGYEIRDFRRLYLDNAEIRIRQIHLTIADVMADETVAQIERYTRAGRAAILCDTCDKVATFGAYAKLLKRGDVIMAHDYARDEETFREHRGERWNWFEVSESDLTDVCEAEGLEDFYPEFAQVAWACKIKA